MENRFDWNLWLTTIPGIPANWPMAAPTAQAEELFSEVDYFMELPKAA